MVKYWLCVTNPTNFEIVLHNEVWGIEDNGRIMGINERGPTPEIFNRNVQIGDHLLFYIKNNKIIRGVYEVASNPYRDSTPKWPDRIYPNRIKIREVNLGRTVHPISITRHGLIQNLNFIREPTRWHTYLQCSMRLIPQEDYRLILSLASPTST